MTKIRKLVRAQINTLGDREVEVVMSTAALARDGHILVPQGCRLDNYRTNPIVLWSHDPEHPIGNSEDIAVDPAEIRCRIVFAPAGISNKADEICGLMKAGVLRAVSVGFDPIEAEPLDPKKPRGGQRITQWELFELSPVSVPADTGAVVTARSHGDDTMAQASTTQACAAAPASTRASAHRGGKIGFKRGLYQVAQLCYLFMELGWHVDMAAWESAYEEDDSKVPGMLAAVFHDLGDALLAMTQEEIAEALAGCDVEPLEDAGDEVLTVEERAHIRAAKTPQQRALRRGLAHAKLRAGKTLSAETVRCLRAALAKHGEAVEETRSAVRKHKDAISDIQDLLDRAGVSDSEDDETQTVQTSDGTDVSEGSENGRSADFRRRQAELRRRRARH